MTDRSRSTAASRWGAVAACLALLTTGCTQAQQGRTLGIGPSDVDRIEVYLYTFSEDPRTVTRSVVEDRREIAELVSAFTDMPGRPLRLSFEEVRGAKASGLRFHLRDGGAVEVYLYTFSEDPLTVTRSVVEDRREIAELVSAFTDMPVRPLRLSFEEVRGAKASGLRFHLRDGGAVEVTQVFRGPGDTVVAWPDSPAVQTEWGSGIGDHGTPGDPSANSPVSPEERPAVVLR